MVNKKLKMQILTKIERKDTHTLKTQSQYMIPKQIINNFFNATLLVF